MPAEDTRAVAGFCSEEPQRLELNTLVEASCGCDVCIQDLQEVSTRMEKREGIAFMNVWGSGIRIGG